jgi:tetratricopeptide (TPR) repeat protein
VPVTDAAPNEAFPKARQAAARALEIDDQLAEAYVVMGCTYFSYDWDWAEAERNLKRAVEINPNSALARFYHAHLLSNLGRHEEAIPEIKRALDLDPLSTLINSVGGQLFYHAREYDKAIEQAGKVLELDPDLWIAHSIIGKSYIEKRMYSEAIAEHEKAVKVSGGATETYSQLGYAHAVAGNREQAERIIDELKRLSKHRYVPLNNIARIYAGLGDKEKALDLLEKALHERETGLTFLKVVPQWDALRAEPRFMNILHRVGLSE